MNPYPRVPFMKRTVPCMFFSELAYVFAKKWTRFELDRLCLQAQINESIENQQRDHLVGTVRRR